jgi:hypothetical protein
MAPPVASMSVGAATPPPPIPCPIDVLLKTSNSLPRSLPFEDLKAIYQDSLSPFTNTLIDPKEHPILNLSPVAAKTMGYPGSI